ncbi:hypothetical protein A3A49_02640 [Candidatus Curtissbacteria bacterium RIFCSPLOWO2_01_FULL_38_11b]|uniref:SpoVT-AbrB domain-containing protein n=1 Tax=Candidatus Curtissbacteria bacterium RIFCSPLOWO2_01_FULL_38_11b TaxID=1797725 RepID=A0A1F5H3X6_9BACT|nr:MAG: hypothetical protein A3A49_02640 [Candidatus Curtissbacteria bacterium RIFCSPLOWO2_01_FULL_38_11b]
MQQVTVGTKYQIVIPKEVRKKIKGIKPGTKVVVGSVDDQTITVRKLKKNWLEATQGIAKEAWKNVDTTKYLEDLRNEWEK